ncbi:uncharacterized protein LOC122505815 isoform X2 [Leptopilina heterotoma]|uniref:uncharacterized protein LOC122505815 isoform X2 n=1 Tax=Leptopilina heterotoma TaxID=63436 RepID=UPI001CA7BACB|nr:uncharacterized protein LOC122505815 isoform X2 [Leptopilina heterotoma]
MKSMTIKIQELKIEISDFNKQVKETSKQMEKLNFEINHAKSMTAKVNCIINDLTHRFENLSLEFKIVHECYQRLPERSMQEHIQRQISKRKEILLQEKQKLMSQLGRIKLNRSWKGERLQELNSYAMFQQKQKKTLILNLQENIKQSEVSRKKAMTNLRELKEKY